MPKEQSDLSDTINSDSSTRSLRGGKKIADSQLQQISGMVVNKTYARKDDENSYRLRNRDLVELSFWNFSPVGKCLYFYLPIAYLIKPHQEFVHANKTTSAGYGNSEKRNCKKGIRSGTGIKESEQCRLRSYLDSYPGVSIRARGQKFDVPEDQPNVIIINKASPTGSSSSLLIISSPLQMKPKLSQVWLIGTKKRMLMLLWSRATVHYG